MNEYEAKPTPTPKDDEVMVFDMSTKPSRSKPKKATPKPPNRFLEAGKGNEESKDVEIFVSDKDKSRLEKRHIDQTRAELDHYKHLIDKALGSDETLRDKGRHKGGEIVEIETAISSNTGQT